MIRLGMDSVMYYWDPASGAWVVLGNATSRSFDLTASTADTTTFANDGWRSNVATLKEGSVSFEMMWDTEDTSFQVVQQAFMDSSYMLMMIQDRAKGLTGSEGLHAAMIVSSFAQTADLEDAMKASVELKITTVVGQSTYWQRTYTCAAGFTPAIGDPCYYDAAAGTISATATDVFVGDATEAGVGGDIILVDVSATAP